MSNVWQHFYQTFEKTLAKRLKRLLSNVWQYFYQTFDNTFVSGLKTPENNIRLQYVDVCLTIVGRLTDAW